MLRFHKFKERLNSFKNVSWPNNIKAQPVNLAEAGFYYIGPKDRVKCAYCEGKLRKWLKDDIPFKEHEKHFPDCFFVKNKNYLVKYMRSTFDNYITAEELMKIKRKEKGQLTKMNQCELAKNTLIKMGFSNTVIEKAMVICCSETLIPNIHNLLPFVQKFERNLYFDDKNSCDEITGMYYVKELEKLNNNLTKENDEFKNHLTCKVCLLNQVDLLILPCRHFVLCKYCGEQIIDCPMCRGKIIGIMDVFMC